MKFFFFCLTFLIVSCSTFQNTNNKIIEKKAFIDFLKWRLSRKSPKEYQIEITKNWRKLEIKDKNYFVWIGHSSFLINLGGKIILTDPIFSNRASPVNWLGPKRLISPSINIDELPKIDVVIVSHNHYNHLDIKSLKKIKNKYSDTLFLVPKGDKSLLKRNGITNVQEFLWWENFKFSRINFTFTPVQHWSRRGLFDKNRSLWGGWFIKNKYVTIFHAGDSGYSNDFQETRKRLGSVDIALIPTGAYEPRWFMKNNHLNPYEAILVAKDLKAKKSIAMHWGTFALSDEAILDPKKKLKKELKKLEMSPDFFIIPRPGDIVRFFYNTKVFAK